MMKDEISADDRWLHLIGALAGEVAQASEAHPTVRVWKDSELISLISGVIRRHRDVLKTTFPPAQEVVERLQKGRWLRRISVTEDRTGRTFFLMDHEAPDVPLVVPEEVLLAALPSGVLSYFTALQFYDLTTQPPPFAHIGLLAHGQAVEPPPGTSPPPGKNPLGTPLFCLCGVPCYQTKRYLSLTPGISMRIQDDRTWYRVTTLEQTLLDTLLQPERCGGEAVIFEAWEKGLPEVDWRRLAGHVEAIGRDSLARRLAVMLRVMSARLESLHEGAPLAALLAGTRERLAAQAPPVIPLLPGLDYEREDAVWKVTFP